MKQYFKQLASGTKRLKSTQISCDSFNSPCPLERLVTKQALRYVSGIGPWIQFTDTVHEMLSHLPETIGL